MSPLSLGWQTLTRYPSLVLVPLLWEAFAFLVNLGLGACAVARAGRQINVKFLLPPSLPAGSELLGKAGAPFEMSVNSPAIVPGFLLMLLSALVIAGYLHLLAGALHDEPPSLTRFTEGVRRFGGRLLLWHLLGAVVLLVVGLLTKAVGVVAMVVFLVVALLFYLVDFLVVVEDTSLTDAISSAPALLRRYLGELLPVFVASIAASALLSLALSALGLDTRLVAAPLWAWFGTWVALAVCVVVDDPDPQW